MRTLLADLVRRRELVVMLARQDVAARYRSAVLGLLWTVALPLLQGAVLAVVFTRVVRVETPEPYAGFVLLGMAVWSYVNGSVQAASTSVVDGGSLATKVYFPRLVLPAVAPAANLVGFGLALLVAVVVASAQRGALAPQVALLPAVALLAAALAYVVGAGAALLHVYVRDVRYVVTALLLLAFYGTPVIYPPSLAGSLEPLVLANPASGLVQAARWCAFGSAEQVLPAVAVTVGWVAVVGAVVALAYARLDRDACDRL